MMNPDAELRVVAGSEGRRYLFVADGSRIYDLADDLPGTPTALATLLSDLSASDRRRIDARPLVPPPLHTLSLNVAQACNMGCSYCYADEGAFGGKPRRMTAEVARAAVDRLLEEARPGGEVVIGFMGGEPFLARDLVHDTVGYATGAAHRTGRRIRFSVTTNGTLLTEADARLLSDHPFHVAVSIDGPKELHDAHRPMKANGSAYDRIMASLAHFERIGGRPRHLSARVTVTPRTGRLLPILDHLVTLGFDEVGFSPVLAAPPGREAFAFDSASLDHLLGAMTECGTVALQRLKRRSRYPFSNLETALAELHRGTHRPYPCGAGAAYLSVGADGGLYACHRLVDDPNFAMGDVYTGSARSARATHLAERHVDRQEPCRGCWARYLCGGGCYHEIERRGRAACDFIRGWLSFCIAAYADLEASAPDYFSDPTAYFREPATVPSVRPSTLNADFQEHAP